MDTRALLEDDDQAIGKIDKKCCYFTNPGCYPLFRGVNESTMPKLHSALLSMVVFVLALSAHLCFWQGQKANLYQFELKFHADNIVVNAEQICEVLNLPNINASDCKFALSTDAEPYVLLKQGYWQTITTIWNLYTPADYYLKGWKYPWETRLGAILVFIFSGLWPHLKLVLLQITWYVPMPPKIRRSFCFWLDMFGKWSLLDVLVISLTVALFDLSWKLTADNAVGNIVFNLPPLLESTVLVTPERTKDFAKQTCFLIWSFNNDANQTICQGVMDNFILSDIGFDRDFLENTYELLTNHGDLTGMLQIGFQAVSQSGVYWFSAGVSLSLLAGVFVDIVDDRMTSHIRRNKRLSAPPKSIVEDATSPPVCTPKSYACGVLEVFALILGILFYLGMTFLPTIKRKAVGPLAELVTMITNSTTDKSFTLVDIVNDITAGGGGNPFLQKDSIVFLFVGPVLLLLGWAAAMLIHRPFCASKLPGSKDTVVVLLKVFATATAWEVLLIAELIIMLEMPTLTSSLLDTPDQLYRLQTWLENIIPDGFEYGIQGFNIEVDFTIWWYVVVMLGGIFMQVGTFVLTLVLQRDTHHNKGSGDYRAMSTHVAGV